jgi:hypothetical protein
MFVNLKNLDIIKISSFIQFTKCTHQKNSDENPYLNIFYNFLKDRKV